MHIIANHQCFQVAYYGSRHGKKPETPRRTAGHLGRDRTLATLRRWFYWPQMARDVHEYVRTCDACQRSKGPKHLPYGELTPIPVPDGPWKAIAIDFITDLPPSKGPLDSSETYDSIMTVVDRFSKMCHYIPCKKTMTSKQFASLFVQEVFRLHGIPESIISDRDNPLYILLLAVLV